MWGRAIRDLSSINTLASSTKSPTESTSSCSSTSKYCPYCSVTRATGMSMMSSSCLRTRYRSRSKGPRNIDKSTRNSMGCASASTAGYAIWPSELLSAATLSLLVSSAAWARRGLGSSWVWSRSVQDMRLIRLHRRPFVANLTKGRVAVACSASAVQANWHPPRS